MANTSDGGKDDPPDPSKANINTDALSISPPAAHSAKIILVSTGIDPDIQFFVHTNDNDDEDALNVNPPKTTGTVSATTTSVSTALTICQAKTVPISSRTEPVLTQKDHGSPNSSDTSPPADSDHPDRTKRNSFNAPMTNTSNDQADECPTNSWTTVLASYRRCQEPSYAANTDTTMTDANKAQTDAWNNNPWSTAATGLSQPVPTVPDDTPMTDTTSTAKDPKCANKIDPTSDCTTLTATMTWTPIKTGWNSNMPANNFIHDPNPTSSPVVDAKTSQHPFILKNYLPLFP